MSLLLDLTRAAGGSTTTSWIPATTDPVLASMRPKGRQIAEYLVRQDGTGTHTSITAAIASAVAAQNARLDAELVPRVKITPNYRVDIVIGPGDYQVTPSDFPDVPQWVNLYAQDPTQRPRLWYSNNGGPAGVIMTRGRQYIEGLIIEQDRQYGTAWPKYPIHHSGTGATVIANCVLLGTTGGSLTTQGTPVAHSAIGMDGADHSNTVLYRVQMPRAQMNMHGWVDYEIPNPLSVCYVECLADRFSHQSSILPEGVRDDMWVVGCTTDPDGSLRDITPNGQTALHLDPAHVGSPTIRGNAASTQDARTDWPVPVGGLTPYDRAYYGM